MSSLQNALADVLPGVIGSTTAIVGILALFYAMSLRDRSRSHYDDERRRAELSLIRDSYERRISDLVEQMLGTEQRWRDVNHLLLEQQSRSEIRSKSDRIDVDSFLNGFGITHDAIKQDKRLVFVLTPFSSEEQSVFNKIKETCSSNGFRCIRGDEENATGAVLAHIVENIVKARVVIANITSRNANVFYELGIAHALGKRVILVAKSGQDIPFDVRSQRIVIYNDEEMLRARLTEALLGVLAE